ncbi:nickel-binding protein [Roseovarius arcticus]|uniref:nickel-binding protein n=1 Tax=Roseovarius arcticus TaxID=2547404 RepID=UPI00111061EA|nr:nickel-binding protein [Roseovarius arcticus]
MQLYMIRRQSAWANQGELEKAAALSSKVGNDEMADKLRWIRSYVIDEPDGRLGTCCIYEAIDGEAIKEHARRVGMPGDDFIPIAATVVVRPDPVGP